MSTSQINRILLGDNGSISDLTLSLNDPHSLSSAFVVVAAEDYLYLGSDLPFNNRFFKFTTPNTNSSAISVRLWDGSSFEAGSGVDVLDETSLSGASFGQDGVVSWKLNKNKSWVKEDTNDTISELSSVTIYDMYWCRIQFDADFSAGTSLKYVGHRFCDEDLLGALYPDLALSTTKDKFETGKTDWDSQLIIATDSVIRKLKSFTKITQKIRSENQILDYEVFSEATAHKCAQIIFRAFGDSYKDDMELAKDNFKEAMDVGIARIDKNRDARLNMEQENVQIQGLFRR